MLGRLALKALFVISDTCSPESSSLDLHQSLGFLLQILYAPPTPQPSAHRRAIHKGILRISESGRERRLAVWDIQPCSFACFLLCSVKWLPGSRAMIDSSPSSPYVLYGFGQVT